MTPLVSHVGAVAYSLFPELRRALPPERIEAMSSIEEFWAALRAVAPETEAPLRANPLVVGYLTDDERA